MDLDFVEMGNLNALLRLFFTLWFVKRFPEWESVSLLYLRFPLFLRIFSTISQGTVHFLEMLRILRFHPLLFWIFTRL